MRPASDNNEQPPLWVFGEQSVEVVDFDAPEPEVDNPSLMVDKLRSLGRIGSDLA